MAERASESNIIELPMSRQDIADYLGLTIETVSRTFSLLEAAAAIEVSTSRRIVLRNCAALGTEVHGVDAAGQVVLRRQLKRRYVLTFFEKLPPCLVGIEACALSHHWSRELQALGHSVRLMPPAYVKPTSNGRRMMWALKKKGANLIDDAGTLTY
jgi:Mn-dependent DtxR family transcriptional regulator